MNSNSMSVQNQVSQLKSPGCNSSTSLLKEGHWDFWTFVCFLCIYQQKICSTDLKWVCFQGKLVCLSQEPTYWYGSQWDTFCPLDFLSSSLTQNDLWQNILVLSCWTEPIVAFCCTIWLPTFCQCDCENLCTAFSTHNTCTKHVHSTRNISSQKTCELFYAVLPHPVQSKKKEHHQYGFLCIRAAYKAVMPFAELYVCKVVFGGRKGNIFSQRENLIFKAHTYLFALWKSTPTTKDLWASPWKIQKMWILQHIWPRILQCENFVSATKSHNDSTWKTTGAYQWDPGTRPHSQKFICPILHHMERN